MYKIDTAHIERIITLLVRAKTDKLAKFVAQGYIVDLLEIQKTNFDNLMTLCDEYNIRYIAITQYEMCGCEGIMTKERFTRCAVWTVSEKLGISGGCGNSDQHQLKSGPWFPEQCYGEWNVPERRKLFQHESDKLVFKYVCRGQFGERDIFATIREYLNEYQN